MKINTKRFGVLFFLIIQYGHKNHSKEASHTMHSYLSAAGVFKKRVIFQLINVVLLSLCFFLSWQVNAASNDPYTAAEAFQLTVKQTSDTLYCKWVIKPGHFLYQKSLTFSTSTTTMPVDTIHFPAAMLFTDAMGHRHAIYRHSLELTIKLPADQADQLITVHYQGCSDQGYCYPPQHKKIKISPHKVENSTPISFFHNVAQLISNPSATFQFSKPITLGAFWLFGLLLAFTPCMLPMVPILSGILIRRNRAGNLRVAFLLSSSYVLSMAGAYALIGFGFAWFGKNIQLTLQTPWAIVLMSTLLFALSLSLFNIIPLEKVLNHVMQRLSYWPTRWQQRISMNHAEQRGFPFMNAILMGGLSTLILSPCLTAPLIGALEYITQTGNIAFGTLTLFFMGLGIGTPLLIMGTSIGKYLPRAGRWMNGIKYLFAGILLWMAAGLLLKLNVHSSEHLYQLSEVQQAIKMAKNQQKPVVLDFYADWCTSCKHMQHELLENPEIKKALSNVVWLTVDLTPNNRHTHALLQHYNVVAPPTLLFFNKQGKEVRQLRSVGAQSSATLLKQLAYVEEKK